MAIIIEYALGIFIPFGTAILLCSLIEFDEIVFLSYFTFFMGITLYGDLIELWMFITTFVIFLLVLGFRFYSNQNNGNNGGNIV